MPRYEADTLHEAISKAVYGENYELKKGKKPSRYLGGGKPSHQIGKRKPRQSGKHSSAEGHHTHSGRSLGTGATVEYVDPSVDELRSINSAFRHAQRLCRTAQLQAIRRGRDDLFNLIFGVRRFGAESQVDDVIDEIAATSRLMDSKRSDDHGVVRSAHGLTTAEVLQDDTIVFYPRHFDLPPRGQALNVIHECIHLATRRTDIPGGYTYSGIENLAARHPENAMNNVSSLVRYISELGG